MESVTVTKESEPYVQPGFVLPLTLTQFMPDNGASRVRLGGKDVQALTMSLRGFRDKRFDMRWRDQVFRGCHVVDEQETSAVVEYASTEKAAEE